MLEKNKIPFLNVWEYLIGIDDYSDSKYEKYWK